MPQDFLSCEREQVLLRPPSLRDRLPEGHLAVTAGQVVIAAGISVNSPDFGLLGPVLDAALSGLEAVGVAETPGVLVADTGYWHQVQIDQIVEHGIDV